MALDATRLGAAIAAAVDDIPPENRNGTELWGRVAEAIVDEIQNNADVEAGIVVTDGETELGAGKIN